MSSETEIYFPDTLPFPFTVRSLIRPKGSSVEQGHRLLNYSFTSRSSEPGSRPETRFGSWDATFEGELRAWGVQPGDVVSRERAKARPALRITESCKHGVQFNGLCALCGMDMTSFDYTGRAESSKANIQMTHSASGPTVSLEEAQRLERETAEHLLKSRKLTLIVDLDQTIVHATVDPTVGDWITEGEEWEARHTRNEERRARAAAKKGEGENKSEESDSSDDSDDDEEEEEEEVNPNWEALKDVKKFRLAPDNFGAPRPHWPNQRAYKGIQDEGCLYYIKPRPGWTDFLPSVATKYEMHVYTMGTRAYAEKVCAAIDPDGKLFGNRILSRDESGSLTQKSLRRLFPCDQSMVVIIDDRADVWEWSPNLLKVVPYDFFVGIGDINSAFLPKVDAMGTANLAPSDVEGPKPTESSESASASTPTSVPSSVPPESSGSDASTTELTEPSEEDRATSEKSEMITKNALALEAQVEERPLAKKQEQLESDDEEDDQSERSSPGANGEAAPNGASNEQGEHAKKHHRKALLKNDDFELLRINELLDEIHKRFFTAYDNRIPESSSSKRRRSIVQREVPYDVKYIIPNLRKETFRDVHILFSGVIPTNMRVDHENTEIWRMARAFGATCHKDLVKEVTHVVTSKRGTQKVEKARLLTGVSVVWIQWFSDSIAQWHRQDEGRYLLDVEEEADDAQARADAAAPSPPSDPNAVSSDTDPEALVGDGDEDDEDMEDALEGARGANNGSRSASVSDGEGEGDGRGRGAVVPAGELDLNDVDWQNVNDEVDAAMAESDSDDEDGDGRRGGSSRSSVVSEDESMDEDRKDLGSLPQTPRRERKRLRSVTPSESGGAAGAEAEAELLMLRSPLAKRKRVAAARSGAGAGGAAGLHEAGGESSPGSPAYENGSQGSFDEEGDEESGEEEGEEGDDIEDDFLAREMEEELG